MFLMRICALLLAAVGLCAAADAPTSFTGIVGDDMCNGDHKAMGGTDPVKCTDDCMKFVGKKVTVTGTLNGKELQVKSIKSAN